jgi:hypothetical protein
LRCRFWVRLDCRLFISLEVSEDSFDQSKDEFCKKDALHLFGVNDMSTNEVFDYLNKYRPYAIEWINDSSCNVLWANLNMASFALFEYTKPFEAKSESPRAEEVVPQTEESAESKINDGDASEKDSDDWKSIESTSDKLAALAGQKWRVGLAAKNGNLIYMRYAKNTDKKIKGAESRSKYYVKYGNPNYGNLKGFISTSKRTQLKSMFLGGLSDRGTSFVVSKRSDKTEFEESYAGFEGSNTFDSDSNTNDSTVGNKNKEILKRLSFPNKKKHTDSEDESDDRNKSELKLFTKSSKRPKMSMYADDFEKPNK